MSEKPDEKPKKKPPRCWLCGKPITGRVYYQADNHDFPAHKGCRVAIKRAKDGGI